jgi:hypothetical protein
VKKTLTGGLYQQTRWSNLSSPIPESLELLEDIMGRIVSVNTENKLGIYSSHDHNTTESINLLLADYLIG